MPPPMSMKGRQPPFKKKKLPKPPKNNRSTFDGKITEDDHEDILELRRTETPEQVAKYLKKRKARWPSRARQKELAEKRKKQEEEGIASGKPILTIQERLKRKRNNKQKQFRQNFARREQNLLGKIFAKEMREEKVAILDCLEWIEANMMKPCEAVNVSKTKSTEV